MSVQDERRDARAQLHHWPFPPCGQSTRDGQRDPYNLDTERRAREGARDSHAVELRFDLGDAGAGCGGAEGGEEGGEACTGHGEAGEPWVSVLSMELEKDTLDKGAFELDWNDIFVAKLVRAGYQGKTDNDIVDQWFQAVCRNIVLESFEKEQAQNVEVLDEGRKAYR